MQLHTVRTKHPEINIYMLARGYIPKPQENMHIRRQTEVLSQKNNPAVTDFVQPVPHKQ